MLLSILSYAQPGEEFSGAFSSWANVKNRFGAIGDGKKDDTKAFQIALDSLSVPPKNFNIGGTGYTTIYLPPGNYRITSTLVLKGKIGINIIGEDPRTTFILWDGSIDQTMLLTNGASYFKISRISWNANNKKLITSIGFKWKTRWDDKTTQSFAPLNIEISDCYFIGKPAVGISGGTYVGTETTGANDSEVTILRCYFTECLNAGIQITGFNALDYWIWDCRFIKCNIGIGNAHGNFHAYRCYFEESRESDFINDNGYYTSVRGCYSLNSSAFSNDRGASCNPFKRIFQGNQVKPLKENSIYFAHIGKPVFLDNTFAKGRDKAGEYTLHYSSWCPGIYEVLSMGNRYAMAVPFRMAVSKKRTFSIRDTYKYAGELSLTKHGFLATQDPLPLKTNRKIFEVPENSTSEAIQSIINKAALLKKVRSLVHFGYGTYILNKPLVVSSGSDIEFVGDGLIYASVLKKAKSFPKGKSMLKISGPANFVIRDLQIAEHDGAVSNLNVIEFVNVDQPGSMAFLDQLHTSSTTSVEMNKLDFLYVQKQNSFFSSGNRVYGGKLLEAGKGTSGLYCFGGQFADLTVEGNGRFVSKDCWWEGTNRKPLDISGSGNITIDGVMIAPVGADSNITVSINKFNGRISLLNSYIQGGLSVMSDNPTLSILLWNIHFYHKMNPTQFISRKSNFKGAFLGLSAQCFKAGDPNCDKIISLEDRVANVPDENGFIQEMLSQDRTALPRRYTGKINNASTIFLSRVSIGNSSTAIRFTN